MAATTLQMQISFPVSGLVLPDIKERSKSISRPNFAETPQSTIEILLFPVSENKRAPYWNSTSGVDIHLFVVIVMPFCIGVANFI